MTVGDRSEATSSGYIRECMVRRSRSTIPFRRRHIQLSSCQTRAKMKEFDVSPMPKSRFYLDMIVARIVAEAENWIGLSFYN